MPGAPEPAYIEARRTLLHALDALAAHRGAVILIGAQAIYLRTGDSGLAVAPYTTDADLVLDPTRLGPTPRLEEAMLQGGFQPHSEQVGIWVGGNPSATIDLLVPEALAGRGRRAARLPPRRDGAARRGRGPEAALIENSLMTIEALDPNDTRHVEIAVAGPAALLVMKLHKLADRRNAPGRQSDKDALDTFRLLQAIPTLDMENGFHTLLAAEVAATVTNEAIAYLRELFATEASLGSQMAARAVGPLDDPVTVAASCALLAQELLDAVGAG